MRRGGGNSHREEDETLLVENSHVDHNSTHATRWEAFWVLNRHRPWKQMRIILLGLLCVCTYGYSLLHSSWPMYNVVQVAQVNRQFQHVSQQERLQRQAMAEERRQARLAKRKQERTLRQNKTTAMDHAMFHKNNHNTTTTIGNQTTLKQRHGPIFGLVRFISSGLVLFTVLSVIRIVLRICVLVRLNSTNNSNNSTTARLQQTRLSRQGRQSQFRAWVRDLNRQRTQQGERPLSIQSLRMVLQERNFQNGNNYEDLLRFAQESGPAMQSLLANIGATQEEINRCPQRILFESDDLLQVHPTTRIKPNCAICLEYYEVNQEVRTIPCFHTFHTACIDPWLAQKAVCPVCKHPAVA